MRPSTRLPSRAALVIGMASVLAGCGAGGNSSPLDQVTGAITVRRSFPSCDVTVKLHNDTPYHLTSATFNITGYDDNITVKDTMANGDDSESMSIPIGYDGSSCLAIASKIEEHASDDNVGTCTMEGATEGKCQHLFAFHSEIDPAAIQGDIDKLKSGNLKVGDAAPLKDADGASLDVATEIGGQTSAACTDNSTPTWNPAVMDIHRDGDGVADAYQVGGACPDGTTVQGWVARQGANT